MDSSILLGLTVCIFFGGFGGLTAHFINNEKTGISEEDKLAHKTSETWYVFPSYFQSICIGVSGAIGFLFFIIAVGGISTGTNAEEIFRIASSSVISGFGARSLLSKMAGHLEKQVAEAKSMAEEAVDEAKANDARIELLEANVKLIQAAHPHATPVMREEAIRGAQKLISNGKENAGTWINLARVYRWNGNLAIAITTLNEAIIKMNTGKFTKKNFSPAHYNRGCYKALQYKDNKDKELLASSLADLKVAIDTALEKEAEINAVWNDADWNHLANEADFTAIVGQKR